jgi:hypothetical protein
VHGFENETKRVLVMPLVCENKRELLDVSVLEKTRLESNLSEPESLRDLDKWTEHVTLLVLLTSFVTENLTVLLNPFVYNSS